MLIKLRKKIKINPKYIFDFESSSVESIPRYFGFLLNFS